MRSKKKPGRNNNRGSEFNLSHVSPLTKNQAKVLGSDKHQVLIGYAGTGKTFLATYLAYKYIFELGTFNKLIYMRSAVPTRDLGFLPGTAEEKVEVYEAPYVNAATKLFGRGDSYDILKKKGIVDFHSTSFVRGINLDDTILIVDECQNMTLHELDSIITRLESNCKIFLCGDIKQADLRNNGFADFYRVLMSMDDEFDVTEFQKEDIVRSDLVKKYIIAKERILNKM